MRIRMLIENKGEAPLSCEHGLSIYVETAEHRILFDCGASDGFARNAALLGVDLSEVDVAVLSHGHYDHGGGLRTFLELNQRAPVYMQRGALEGHFANDKDGGVREIGIEWRLGGAPQVRLLDGDAALDEQLYLFSHVQGARHLSQSNRDLLVEDGGQYAPDPFAHEQSLLIKEGEDWVLLAGCAHRGIVNIVEQAMAITGRPLALVVSGFHLSNPALGGSEAEETVAAIAHWLMQWPTRYYTGHCTGDVAYAQMKEIMGEQLQYAATGSDITYP